MTLSLSGPTGFAEAWQYSLGFWSQTLRAVGRHPVAVLFCAVVPAAERAYLLLSRGPIPRWRLTLSEALMTLWRILFFVVAIWVALDARGWKAFRSRLSNNIAWQMSMQKLGAYLGKALHLLLWELLLYVAAFVLLNYLLVLLAEGLARVSGRLRERSHRRAFVSILRNLLLFPLALIYLVMIARQAFA